MPVRRASLILPGSNLDDFPTHLAGQAAAELLNAWTSLWHPALLAATGKLPGWHPAQEPPDPVALEDELVLVPAVSRERMAGDWLDRLRATGPRNPPPVESVASRSDTVAALLAAAQLDAGQADNESAADFLALGYANLQVELLTRAMRYSSVLDTEHFESATVAAARAAVAGNREAAREELARAFDLLADARNHIYSVDFYVIDLTLLTNAFLGEPLRKKLAAGRVTNVLLDGEQLERLAAEHPETLSTLQRALEAGTAAIVGGRYHAEARRHESPETLLADLSRGQETARRLLNREYEVFGQFAAAFSPLLPEVLKGLGFRGALHAAFDGGHLPRADQRKTNWGADSESAIDALSITPLNAALPETWLKLAERVGDSLAHDHVATILLAAWPGTECEFFEDLRRTASFGPVLGKLVTIDEYFRVTREPDDWVTFKPHEYPPPPRGESCPNLLSTEVDAHCREVETVHQQLAAGLAAVAGLQLTDGNKSPGENVAAINAWNFLRSLPIGSDPLTPKNDQPTAAAPLLLPDVPGCGYAAFSQAAQPANIALAEDLILRNERLELTVSKTTGGIQSIRTHRDRSTRVSQRLVFHESSITVESQMVADECAVTGNDPFVGEITSRGRIVEPGGEVLARFTQRVRTARGLSPMIVDVDLEPVRSPQGGPWNSYYASRLAWAEEALAIRCGDQWVARETSRERIESPDWIEIDDAVGKVHCFACGLPLHRRASPTWLDTLLLVAGEERHRFQLAIGVDDDDPAHTARGLLTVGNPLLVELPGESTPPRGWFVHVAAKNILITHVEPITPPASGIRLRLLETAGRETRTTVTAFRPFKSARTTDFRAHAIEVLSLDNGRAEIDLGPHHFIQMEAEFDG